MADDNIPSELKTEVDRINTGVGRFFARIITFGVTPLLLPIMTAFAYWVQKWLNLDLDAAELTGYLSTVAGGIGITIFKYVSNRGEWERSVIQLAQWYQLGQEAGGGSPPPLPPKA